MDITFEVKTVKAINLKKAWDQVNIAASKHGNMPVLAVRFDNMPKNEWLVTIHSEDFAHYLNLEHPSQAPPSQIQ